MRSLLPTLRPALAARRLAARLAVFAVLAAALVPGFSRLLQADGIDAWGVLCQSAAAVATPGDPASELPTGAHEHGDACALCTLAHTTPVLAGAAPAGLAIVSYAPPPPPASVAVRSVVAQVRVPGARAPPSLS